MFERAQQAWTDSKLYWTAFVLLQVFSGGLATWVAWVRPEHGWIAVVLPVLGVLIPITSYLLRSAAGDAYARGEVWRRGFLLNDSLGYEPGPGEYANLLLDDDGSGVNLQRKPPGKYYASELPVGHARLLENLSESAFYTAHLSRVMARLCWSAVAVMVCVLVAVLLGVLASPAESGTPALHLAEDGPRFAGVVSSLLAFFATSQIIEVAAAYSKLASASRRILDRAIESDVALPNGAVLLVLCGYESALAAAALPIPNFMIKTKDKRLNKEWAAVRARRMQQPHTGSASSVQ